MQIHELSLKKKNNRKRVGRGGKRGTYSGRGNKGQKARSGGNVDPLFEGGRSSLVERLKKVRGFKSPHSKMIVLNVDTLERRFSTGTAISQEVLVAEGLVKESELKRGVKILGRGKLSKAFTILTGLSVSESARAAILQAGGTVAEGSQKNDIIS